MDGLESGPTMDPPVTDGPPATEMAPAPADCDSVESTVVKWEEEGAAGAEGGPPAPSDNGVTDVDAALGSGPPSPPFSPPPSLPARMHSLIL